jgi:hypothetical protein
MVGGMLKPGRLHTLILSRTPLNRKYTMLDDINVDKNIKDCGHAILQAIREHEFTHVSLLNNNVVYGRSWEMCAAKLLLNVDGVFSGTVESYQHPNIFIFGSVPGISVKKEVYKNIITA